MDQASQDLDQQRSQQAGENQDEALSQLEQADEELAEEEEELESLKTEQDLLDILATVIEMSDEMVEIRDEARTLEREIGERRPNRSQRRKLLSLSERAKVLHTRGDEVGQRLEEERARVFAFIIRDVLQDIDEVRQNLSPRNDPGEETQLLAQEVIDGLDRLRNALEEELRRRKQSQQQQQQQQESGPRQPRLVPPVAELLTLKEMQIEVLQRTRRLEAAKARSGKDFDPVQERILERLVQRQGSLVGLTSEIASDLEEAMSPPPEQEGGEEAIGPDDAEGSEDGGGG